MPPPRVRKELELDDAAAVAGEAEWAEAWGNEIDRRLADLDAGKDERLNFGVAMHTIRASRRRSR